MDTEGMELVDMEGMELVDTEVEGTEVQNRHTSDDVSDRYHLGEGLETRRSARDP